MKSILQFALLLALIVAVIFGLTFFSQNTRSPVEKATGPGATVAQGPGGPPLRILQRSAEWDKADPQYAAEFEKGDRGHFDFWVSNVHLEPVTVSALTKSCVCNEVQIGIVPRDQWDDWRRRLRDLASVNLALAMLGAPNFTYALAFNGFGGKIEFSTMTPRDRDAATPGVTVPPADPVAGPQMAIVRMIWDGREIKAQTLTAEIQHRRGATTETVRFEVPVVVAPAVMMSSPAVVFGELNPNDRREQTLYCWSATRDNFPLTIEQRSPHPCIDVGPPRAMGPDERLEVARSLRAAGLIGPTKMRSAYAIPIVVHERRDGSQLDLGPLAKRYELHSPVMPEPAPFIVQGVVRGDIEIGEEADRDRVNLGSFRADRPHEKNIEIRAKSANLQLRVKNTSPEFLHATLKETSGGSIYRRWKLLVEVEPDKASGFLPGGSAVYLETVSDPPRAIRIPVVGNATVR